MARIAGTGQKSDVRRVRIPKIPADWAVVAVLLAPVAILAPTDWARAITVVAVIAGAWFIGFREGRADMAREVLRDVRRDDRGA